MLATMIFALLLSIVAQANVYLPDDRAPFHAISDPAIQRLAESSVALVRKSQLKTLPNGQVELTGKPLSEQLRMCSDALFSSEPLVANCSGALVGADIVLTAGHCINLNGEAQMGLNDLVAVFNYRQTREGQTQFIVAAEDVHEFERVLYREFVGAFGIDLALIKLKRASRRVPLKFSRAVTPIGTPLFMLGYPLGIPLKMTDGSTLLAHNAPERAFRHELDAFSVNSGSPIFNAETMEIIGVHVRGTGTNTAR
jgi:hypothetical protein